MKVRGKDDVPAPTISLSSAGTFYHFYCSIDVFQCRRGKQWKARKALNRLKGFTGSARRYPLLWQRHVLGKSDWKSWKIGLFETFVGIYFAKK